MKPKKQEMSEENKEKRGRKSGGLIQIEQLSELEAHAEHIVGKFNENKQLPWGS